MKWIIDTSKIYSTKYKTTDIKLRDIKNIDTIVNLLEVMFEGEIIIGLDGDHISRLNKETRKDLGI